MSNRPGWDEYFMEIANIVAKRSTCLRRQVGAVITKDKQVLATGYNGSPSGLAHCEAVGCERERLEIPSGERHEICRALHAEQNAIIQAAKNGGNINHGKLYCTTFPCMICAKMLINAGVEEIIYQEGYNDPMALQMLNEAGVEIRVYNPQGDSSEQFG